MPRKISIKTARSLSPRALLGLVTRLSTSRRTPSLEQTTRLVACAQAIRHAAHLERVFAAWVPSLDERERPLVEALLAGLTVVSAYEGDGQCDDHGGFRGEVHYTLTTQARVVEMEHLFWYNNESMSATSSIRLVDRGAPSADPEGPGRTKPDLRLFFEPPTSFATPAAKLFAYLGVSGQPARKRLSEGTQIRFLMRLLYPWGRYQRGYELEKNFFPNADHLYTLPPEKRAEALTARADDGEVIPFSLD